MLVLYDENYRLSSETVATLSITMYLVGLAAGDLVLAPLSEVYGWRLIYSGSLFILCC